MTANDPIDIGRAIDETREIYGYPEDVPPKLSEVCEHLGVDKSRLVNGKGSWWRETLRMHGERTVEEIVEEWLFETLSSRPDSMTYLTSVDIKDQTRIESSHRIGWALGWIESNSRRIDLSRWNPRATPIKWKCELSSDVVGQEVVADD